MMPAWCRIAELESAGFTIQCYRHQDDPVDADVETALADLQQMPRVRLVDEELDSAAFQSCLASSDVVLLPYAPGVYGGGSSGLFAAAMAGGHAAMHSAMPWSTREVLAHGLARAIATDFDDPTAVAAASVAALAASRLAPDNSEMAYAAWHSPSRLLDQLLAL